MDRTSAKAVVESSYAAFAAGLTALYLQTRLQSAAPLGRLALQRDAAHLADVFSDTANRAIYDMVAARLDGVQPDPTLRAAALSLTHFYNSAARSDSISMLRQAGGVNAQRLLQHAHGVMGHLARSAAERVTLHLGGRPTALAVRSRFDTFAELLFTTQET